MPKIKNWSVVDKKGLNSRLREELGHRTYPYRVWELDIDGESQYIIAATKTYPRSGSTNKVVWMARNPVTGEFYGKKKIKGTGTSQQKAVDESVKWMRKHPEGMK